MLRRVGRDAGDTGDRKRWGGRRPKSQVLRSRPRHLSPTPNPTCVEHVKQLFRFFALRFANGVVFRISCFRFPDNGSAHSLGFHYGLLSLSPASPASLLILSGGSSKKRQTAPRPRTETRSVTKPYWFQCILRCTSRTVRQVSKKNCLIRHPAGIDSRLSPRVSFRRQGMLAGAENQ